MHCVDLGESFQTHIFLQNLASIQPRTSPIKFDVDVGALSYWEPWLGEGNPELIISQGSIKLMSDVNGGVREDLS